MFVVCVVRKRSLRWAYHSSRGVLPTGALLCVIKKPRGQGGHSPHWAAVPEKLIITELFDNWRVVTNKKYKFSLLYLPQYKMRIFS
jgi:hypothetical protein